MRALTQKSGRRLRAGELAPQPEGRGHRIAKHIYASDLGYMLEKSIYYILDAQGNVMSVYERKIEEEESVSYNQTEKYSYGSSRLGVHTEVVPVLGSLYTAYNMTDVTHEIGYRNYELTNHLGNVLSVVSDKVISHDNSGTIDYWLADIRQSTDYSPFGVILYNRDYRLTDPSTSNLVARGRYGFNGYEGDNEVKGNGNSYTTEFRHYDPRIGRWLSLDPKSNLYPSMSAYSAYGNNPILIIDIEGDVLRVHGDAKELTHLKSFLEKAFAGEVEVRIAEDGTITLHGDGSKQQVLYDALNTIINDEKTTDFVVVGEKNRDLIQSGRWRFGKKNGKEMNGVDLYDMEMNKDGILSAGSLLIHELWETYQDQVKGKTNFDDAHEEAIKKQGEVDGVVIFDNYRMSDNLSVTLFSKDDKLYTSEREMSDNNITKVTEKEGWVVPSLDKKGETVTLKTTKDLSDYQSKTKK